MIMLLAVGNSIFCESPRGGMRWGRLLGSHPMLPFFEGLGGIHRMKACRGGWKTHLLILLLLGLECSALAESDASSAAAHNPETDEPPAKFVKLSFGCSLRFRFETYQNFNIKGYGKGGDGFLLERLRNRRVF